MPGPPFACGGDEIYAAAQSKDALGARLGLATETSGSGKPIHKYYQPENRLMGLLPLKMSKSRKEHRVYILLAGRCQEKSVLWIAEQHVISISTAPDKSCLRRAFGSSRRWHLFAARGMRFSMLRTRLGAYLCQIFQNDLIPPRLLHNIRRAAFLFHCTRSCQQRLREGSEREPGRFLGPGDQGESIRL